MLVDYDTCLKILKTRRSIRKFKSKEVPLNVIIKAIDIARYAPSAKNSQPWRFIIISDRSILNRLAKIHSGAKPLADSRIGIVVLSKPSESPTSYMVDASLTAMYIWLSLHCQGLGAVWIQSLRDVDKIRRILKIPDEYIPIGILAIGWPDEEPEPKYRKPLEEITYINIFGNKLEDQVDL